jgi:hypothetical protein
LLSPGQHVQKVARDDVGENPCLLSGLFACSFGKINTRKQEETKMRLRKGDLDTNISFRVPAAQMKRVMAAADELDASISQTVRRLLTAGLEQMEGKRAA